jgi:hypothetical protein
MKFNQKLSEFLEENKEMTVLGLSWAVFWRMYVILFAIGFVLGFLGVI